MFGDKYTLPEWMTRGCMARGVSPVEGSKTVAPGLRYRTPTAMGMGMIVAAGLVMVAVWVGRSLRDDPRDTPLAPTPPAAVGTGAATIEAAIERGDVRAVRAMLAQTPGLARSSDVYGWSALHKAVAKGNRALVDLLLEAGADTNATTSLGLTPLHLAAEDGFAFIISRLLAHGAGVDARDERGNTPMHAAAHLGCVEVVTELLRAGASPSLRNHRGQTPLQVARAMSHYNVVEALMHAGARD